MREFQLLTFLNNYGVLAAFALALIENDVAFIAIGVVAKLGDNNPLTPDLNPWLAVPAAIAGALIHDSFWFGLGHFNSHWIKASKVYRRIGPFVERLANRFGIWQIFLARFIYGTRNPSAVFWGIHQLKYSKFLGVEFLGLAVWGSVLSTIAFHCTGWALRLIGKVQGPHPHRKVILTALAVSFVVVGVLRWINRRRIYRKQLIEGAAAVATEPAVAEPLVCHPERSEAESKDL